MRREVAVVVFLFAVFVVTFASCVEAAAPPAANQQECTLLADGVLVAVAARRAGLTQPQVAALLIETHAEPVALNNDDPALAKKWLAYPAAIAAYVFRPGVERVQPAAFANVFAEACHALRGQVGQIFGEGV